MKKILSLILALVLYASFAIAAPDDDIAVAFEQIPACSRTFVTTHFPNAQVACCFRDNHSFEVRLADAVEIEFDTAGNWKEVDCKYKAVPASVMKLVPEPIGTYTLRSYPSSVITKVKVKAWGYEIELSNGLEVEFNRSGRFLRVDD